MSFGGKNFIDKPDVNVINWGYRYPAILGGSLINQDWRGGTFVTFIDDWTLDRAGPENFVGFLLRSSAGQEGSRVLQSIKPQVTKGIALLVFGTYEFLFYETESVNLRRQKQGLSLLGAPALSPQTLTYNINENLYVSSNGLLTKEQETSGAERIGRVSAKPRTNGGYLGFMWS